MGINMDYSILKTLTVAQVNALLLLILSGDVDDVFISRDYLGSWYDCVMEDINDDCPAISNYEEGKTKAAIAILRESGYAAKDIPMLNDDGNGNVN
jgi:hypothetical protein